MSLEPQVAQPTTTARTSASDQRLVLVDADETARGVLSHTFARLGYQVEAVARLVQARQRLEQRPADGLVISSAAVEANALLAWLRSVPGLQTIPVIFAAPVDDSHIAALAELVSIDVVVRKPAFARDVAALTRWALSRGLTQPVVFDSAVDAPLHVVRGLVAAGATATVRLAQGRAVLTLEAGLVVRCTLGAHWGVDALARALAVTQGSFEVSVTSMAPASDSRQMFKELLHMVAPRLSRFQVAAARGLPLDGVYAVDFRSLAEALPTLPEDAARLVRLFDGKRTLLEVACDSVLNEALTLDVAERLFTMGVITTPVFVTPTQMPVLFEPKAQATAKMTALFEQPLSAALPDGPFVSDWHESVDAPFEETERWAAQPVANALTPDVPAEVLQSFGDVNAPAPENKAELASWRRRETPAIDMPAIVSANVTANVEAPVAASGESVVDDAFFSSATEAPAAAAKKPLKRTLGLVAGLGVAALALSLGVEFTRRPKQNPEALPVALPAVAPAPATAPVQLEPAPLVVADVAESEPIELEDEPPRVGKGVDVPSALSAGLKAQAQGKYRLAAAAFEQVVQAEPSNLNAWMELGLSRHEAGDSRGAQEAVDTIVALDERYARVHMLVAAIHFEAGRTAQAKQALQRYLSLEPAGPHAAEARALLR
jgi:DNA-binding response OmpR family regulator